VGVMVVFVLCSGVDRTPHTCLVQAAGDAFRIGALERQAAIERKSGLEPSALARPVQLSGLARRFTI
jgi:hypothetical protein